MTAAKRGTATAVPRLRFPEFRKANGWVETPFTRILTFQVGFPFPSKGFNAEGAGLRLIRNRDLRSGDNTVHYSDSYSSDYVVDNGDVLVGMDGDFTPCVWNGGRALLNQRVGRVRANQGADPRFLLFILTAHLKALEDITARTTVKHLSHSDVERISAPFPAKPEQQKIADCLTSLDEVISTLRRKVEALRAHKRGLMQQLFPREGETVPRLRFPEFRDAPEWEEATIGSRSKSFSGGTPSTTDKSYYGGEIPFIRSAEIGRATTELLLTEHGLRNSAAKLVEQGDVLVALYGANSGDVALAKTSGAINQAILCIQPKGSKAYLYHFLTARKAWIIATFIQGGQGNLSGEIVKTVALQFPSVEEQQRIADCLSSLDAEIAAETNRLAALKTHKQGLMQQLFPSPVEASA